MKKKGQGFMGPVVGVLVGLTMSAILFAVFGISATFGAKVQSDIGNTMSANSYGANVSTNVLQGAVATSAQSSNVGTIIGFGAIIFLLLAVVGGAMAYFHHKGK